MSKRLRRAYDSDSDDDAEQHPLPPQPAIPLPAVRATTKELEALRAQVASLKQKVAAQQVISPHDVQEVMAVSSNPVEEEAPPTERRETSALSPIDSLTFTQRIALANQTMKEIEESKNKEKERMREEAIPPQGALRIPPQGAEDATKRKRRKDEERLRLLESFTARLQGTTNTQLTSGLKFQDEKQIE